MKPARILVVEDEMLIAMDIEMTLMDAGFDSVVICNGVAPALAEIDRAPPDAALLDLNLGHDTTSTPVALRLQESGTPFIFLSGYNRDTFTLPEALAGTPRVAKPFDGPSLVARLAELLDKRA